eukprot:3831520-Rhodomonas_salina.2
MGSYTGSHGVLCRAIWGPCRVIRGPNEGSGVPVAYQSTSALPPAATLPPTPPCAAHIRTIDLIAVLLTLNPISTKTHD